LGFPRRFAMKNAFRTTGDKRCCVPPMYMILQTLRWMQRQTVTGDG
jgi:hypothetical protein